MKNLHIKNSYKTWRKSTMTILINEKCLECYESQDVEAVLNRSYTSLYIEWWLHNIGYYLTLPLCFIKKINALNLRLKDVDLEEHANGKD